MSALALHMNDNENVWESNALDIKTDSQRHRGWGKDHSHSLGVDERWEEGGKGKHFTVMLLSRCV